MQAKRMKPMDWTTIHNVLVFFQHCVSTIGILIILIGVAFSLFLYLYDLVSGRLIEDGSAVNAIRLRLGRTLILGLEFIVAADLIGTTTTPDYYAVGLLAIIVLVRTVLSFSINRELMSLTKEN
jgi:uncharacterized membrane protein